MWNKEKPAKEDESEIDVIFSVVENHVIYPEEKSRIESEAGLAYILDSDKQDKDKQEDSQQDDSQEKDILNEDGQQEDNQAQSGEQDMAVGNDRSKMGAGTKIDRSKKCSRQKVLADQVMNRQVVLQRIQKLRHDKGTGGVKMETVSQSLKIVLLKMVYLMMSRKTVQQKKVCCRQF